MKAQSHCAAHLRARQQCASDGRPLENRPKLNLFQKRVEDPNSEECGHAPDQPHAAQELWPEAKGIVVEVEQRTVCGRRGLPHKAEDGRIQNGRLAESSSEYAELHAHFPRVMAHSTMHGHAQHATVEPLSCQRTFHAMSSNSPPCAAQN
jgi:hypothetical protein